MQFGITTNIPEHEQQAGRGGRDHKACIVLMIVEKWAYKDRSGNVAPSGGAKPTTKEKQTESAILQFVNTSICRRQFLAEYNNDTTIEGKSYLFVKSSLTVVSALDYDGPFCCDQHANQAFNLDHWLPGQTLPSLAQSRLEMLMDVDQRAAPPKKARKRYRPIVQRLPLEQLLKVWRETVLSNKLGIKGWPSDWILADQHIIKLAREEKSTLKSAGDIVSLLEESREWADNFAEQVYQVIESFNMSPPPKPDRVPKKTSVPAVADNPQLDEPSMEMNEPLPLSPGPSATDLYDTDTTLVNPHSRTSSPACSRCSTPDLDLSLSVGISRQWPVSNSFTFQIPTSPNPRPKKKALME